MKQILHIRLRTMLGIACLMICALPSTGNIGKTGTKVCPMTASFTSDWNSLPLSDVALINSYLSHIQEACRDYYVQRDEEIPTVSWYYVSLKELKAASLSANPTVQITFSLMPYSGAHNPVGIDEVTFAASYTGQVSLVEYRRTEDVAA